MIFRSPCAISGRKTKQITGPEDHDPQSGRKPMQGSDYDEGLVHHHEEGWHHWTKFMLWSVISIG
ncbi:MAG: hypothetical protein CMO08_03170, partial [Thalassospira sp.]|nr:hypothetical protein [Thalassospira sp.]